jgi:hypothetical protein
MSFEAKQKPQAAAAGGGYGRFCCLTLFLNYSEADPNYRTAFMRLFLSLD